MRHFNKIISLCLSFIITSAVCAADLTEDDVRQVIARIDNAIDRADAEALGNELSDDAEITLNFVDQGEKQVMQLSKIDYLLLLEQGWAQFSNYSYHRSDMKVSLQGAKAFITAVVHEEMMIEDQHYSGSSREEATVELIDGKPIVTAVVGHSGS